MSLRQLPFEVHASMNPRDPHRIAAFADQDDALFFAQCVRNKWQLVLAQFGKKELAKYLGGVRQ